MKPPGGNYKPNNINIGKIPMRTTAAGANNALESPVIAARSGSGAQTGENLGAFDGNSGGTDNYTTARVMTASPAELILIMYEQFFELIPDIKRNIQKKSAAAMEPDSERAQAIIEELIGSLDFNIELSKDIGAIYFYVRNLILEANIRFDAGIWDRIESVMRPLYEGFKEASNLLESETPDKPFLAAAGPSIVAGITYGQSKLKEIVVNTKSGITV